MPVLKVFLEGWKTHRKTEIKLAPLTVLVGPNSVGKTSVLEAIRYAANAELVNRVDWDSRARRFLRRGNEGYLVKLALKAESEAYVSLGVQEVAGDLTWTCAWKAEGEGGSSNASQSRSVKLSTHAQRIFRDLVGRAPLLRLDADRLAAPSTMQVGERTTKLGHDGSNLAGALGIMRLFDAPRFDRIEQDLRGIVPTVERIRIVKVPFRETRREYDEHSGEYVERTVELEGAELRFDFVGASDIPAGEASEGTRIALGVLTAAQSGSEPAIVLLDDIERALHPRAQRQLVERLRTLVESTPGLQIIATSHSPYLVDAFRPEEVVVLGLRKDGTAAARRLSEHPDAKRAMEVLSTGEFLAAEEEAWVVGEGDA